MIYVHTVRSNHVIMHTIQFNKKPQYNMIVAAKTNIIIIIMENAEKKNI